MLDAVDKVIKKHIQNLFAVENTPIPVLSLATADADDQVYTQAGTAQAPDQIEFPFASLARLPNIEITDDHMTKKVHTYTNYKFIEGSEVRLTYYRCTLHYSVTIFAESRKVSEDLATALYGRLRKHCQIRVNIQMPVEVEKGVYAEAPMDSDIVLDSKIEQVSPLKLDAAQVYKCRFNFDVKNVNVYHTEEDRAYVFNIYVVPISETEQKGVSEYVMKDGEIL